jgi:membrane protease YdiL (CAAX protease family)
MQPLGCCLAASVVAVVAFLIWPPPLDPFVREGSRQRPFVGLGLTGRAIAMAMLYGVIKTGLAEEVLFRGLIAGTLARRLPAPCANISQTLIFLAPHLLVLVVMPEMWWVLPIVFGGAPLAAWARIRSGSILGPWLLHASANVTMCLVVATKTAP